MVTTIVRNDVSFDQPFIARDANGDAINLTDSTVLFKMALRGSTINKISTACTVTSASQGRCKYTFTGTDTDTSGFYNAELQITFGSGKIITAKLDDFYVTDDLT